MLFSNFILLSLMSLTVCDQLTDLQIDANNLNPDLSRLVDDLIESKIEKIVEENNVKIFTKIQTQNQRIVELEHKFEQ